MGKKIFLSSPLFSCQGAMQRIEDGAWAQLSPSYGWGMAKAWKRGEGTSCQPGPHAERVTSSSNAHSLPAVRLCFTCRRRERWRGALLCSSWNMLSYKIKTKACLMLSGKMSLPCEDPKCLSLQGHAVSLYHPEEGPPFTCLIPAVWQ